MTKVVHMLASKYNGCLHAICSRCIQLQLKSNSVACVPALNKYMKHKPHSHYLIIDSDFICEIIFPKAVQITITHSSNGGHLQRTFKAMSTKMQSAIIRRNSTCLFLFESCFSFHITLACSSEMQTKDHRFHRFLHLDSSKQ